MGQTESGQNDDENCFRACIKQNKTQSRKVQALPHNVQKKSSDVYKQPQEPVFPKQPQGAIQKPQNKQTLNANYMETSLQQRLYAQQATIKKKNSVQHSTNIVTVDPKDPPLVEGAIDTSNQIVLGLQSKFSSTKQTFRGSSSKIGMVKTNIICEATVPETRCGSQQKQSGSQTHITNRTSRTATSKKSKNILMNKIEQIKQKYYERELEIEICHDQREYQAQIDHLEQIDKTFTESSNLPEQSIGQIKAIRNKVLAKLRQKRQKNQAKAQPEAYQSTDQASINVEKSITIHNQLQLYSRQEAIPSQENSKEFATVKKQKKLKNGLNFSGKQLNKSLNNSLPEASVDEKMQFSDYSQESLHEIRELDEQYQDYRSKMTGLSKNQVKSIKPSINNASSNFFKQPTKIHCVMPNNIIEQQNLSQQQHPLKKDESRIQQLSNQIGNENECSIKKSKIFKQEDKGSPASKNNKILHF